MNPTDPIAAVVHPDPYPYYAELVAGAPLIYHPGLKLWLAASAAGVEAVLTHPSCRVRPVAEPVPLALAGTSAGEIFAQLVRMNDGAARHDVPKRALLQGLGALDIARLRHRTETLALAQGPAAGDMDALNRWLFATPVAAIADWLGFPDDERECVVAWMRDFVACLSPLSDDTQLARADVAARELLARMTALVASARDDSGVAAMRRAAHDAGWRDANALVANLVGLLSQTFDATAGLLGNGLIALATQPGVQDAVTTEPGLMRALIAETARFDPSVHHTRRFLAARAQFGEIVLEAGSSVLVVLAAANRDPRSNPQPGRFLLARAARRTFGFGQGAHCCPGEAIAQALAEAALSVLWREGTLPSPERLAWDYRPSVNVRMPVFRHAD